MFVNLFVAASNVVGLWPVWVAFERRRPFVGLLMAAAVVASTLQHLSDLKHDLPGVCLQHYHRELLWFDRVTALALAGFVLHHLVVTRHLGPLRERLLWLYAAPGLVFMAGSEHYDSFVTFPGGRQHPVVQFMAFGIFHSLWHVCAYFTLVMVLYATPL